MGNRTTGNPTNSDSWRTRPASSIHLICTTGRPRCGKTSSTIAAKEFVEAKTTRMTGKRNFITTESPAWCAANRSGIVLRIRRRAGKITTDSLRNWRRISNHDQKRGASQPRGESLHRRNSFVVVRFGHDQFESALFIPFTEKCREEDHKKHQRRDGHDGSANTAEHFGVAPIGVIQMRLRIGVAHSHVRPSRFATRPADEQARGKNHYA